MSGGREYDEKWRRLGCTEPRETRADEGGPV